MGSSGQKTKGALEPISQAYEIQLCALVAGPPSTSLTPCTSSKWYSTSVNLRKVGEEGQAMHKNMSPAILAIR